MTLLTDWDGRDPRGWYVSEKFDGCRVMWDGARFWTRSGAIVDAPAWFTAGLPVNQKLDGEIWSGRGEFHRASAAVRFGTFSEQERFMIFDCPDAEGDWSQRMDAIQHRCPYAEAVEWSICRGTRPLLDQLSALQAQGAEGLVIRAPGESYLAGRTRKVMRVIVAPSVLGILKLLGRSDRKYDLAGV